MKEGEGEGFSFLSSPPSPRLLTLFFAQSLLRGLWLSKQLGNACYAGYFQPFASSAVACSRLSDSGKGTNEWGRCERERHAKGGGGGLGQEKKEKRSFLPFFFLFCASSIVRTPYYLGAWNRLVQQLSVFSYPRPIEEGRDEWKGVQWIVLHDAAPAFSISCPVHCTAKLAELEGSEALWVRVKKGRIFGTIYSCLSNTMGNLLISHFSIHSRGKLDLELWYQSWNRRSLGISLGHGMHMLRVAIGMVWLLFMLNSYALNANIREP